MIFYIILLLIILAIVIWGGVTRWRFVNGRGKEGYERKYLENIYNKNKKTIIWAKDIQEFEKKMNELKKYNAPVKLYIVKNYEDDRNGVLTDLVKNLNLSDSCSILDFGGRNVDDFGGNLKDKIKKFLPNISHTCLNLENCAGTTCNSSTQSSCTHYDGITIPKKLGKFDLIIIDMVLHHTSENAVSLLQQLANITKKYIIIGEELSSLNASRVWQEALFNHDPNGIFRSNKEWCTLFNMLDLKIKLIAPVDRRGYHNIPNVGSHSSKYMNCGTGPCMIYYILELKS